MKNADVVILCGGLGLRLRTTAGDNPKSMVDINGRPFLDILIGYLVQSGFRRFILCIGYKGDKIKRYFCAENSRREILFSQEKTALGTAGALKNAQKLIKSSPVLVMNGDAFCDVNFKELFNFHDKHQSKVSLVLTAAGEEDCTYGIVTLDQEQKITGFNEKKKTGSKYFLSAGIYLLQKEILSIIPKNQQVSLEYDVFPFLINQSFYGYITDKKFIDIGTPKRYIFACDWFSKKDKK